MGHHKSFTVPWFIKKAITCTCKCVYLCSYFISELDIPKPCFQRSSKWFSLDIQCLFSIVSKHVTGNTSQLGDCIFMWCCSLLYKTVLYAYLGCNVTFLYLVFSPCCCVTNSHQRRQETCTRPGTRDSLNHMLSLSNKQNRKYAQSLSDEHQLKKMKSNRQS